MVETKNILLRILEIMQIVIEKTMGYSIKITEHSPNLIHVYCFTQQDMLSIK